MSIVTKTGDKGETSLLFGQRSRKDGLRVRACGEVDELNAAIGVLKAHLRDLSDSENEVNELEAIQKQLINLMGELATVPENAEDYKSSGFTGIQIEDISGIEALIKEIEAKNIQFNGWALPGGNKEATFSDMCRTICRRAEREVVSLSHSEEGLNPHIQVYLNRLSDYFWLKARDLENEPKSLEVNQ